jgi:hypothetical protein
MLCLVRNSFVIACLVAGAFGQSAPPPSSVPDLVPETGFVSSTKYTNAFFGFSMPLPTDPALRDFKLSFKKDDAHHFLFGLQAQKFSSGRWGPPSSKLTAFLVTATRSDGSPDQASQVASGPKKQKTQEIELGGKKFWESDVEEKLPAGKVRSVIVVGLVNGYVLQFNIESFDGKLTDQFRRSIEGITFFDPAKVSEFAGPDSKPCTAAVPTSDTPPPTSRIAQLNPGTVSENTYANEQLGLSYIFPEGWVVNDKAALDKTIEIGHQVAWGDDPSAAREHEQFLRCTQPLLYVTQHPPRTRSDVDSLIFVLASDPTCTPGIHLPTSIDDRDTIKQAAVQIIRSFSGTPFVPKGKPSVNAFEIQGRVMLDISGSFEFKPAKANTPLKVWSTLDFTGAGGYWVLWFFLSGSEAGLQELRDTKIKFSLPVAAPQAQ